MSGFGRHRPNRAASAPPRGRAVQCDPRLVGSARNDLFEPIVARHFLHSEAIQMRAVGSRPSEEPCAELVVLIHPLRKRSQGDPPAIRD